MNPPSPLERLRAWPRVSLVGHPTPVERLERFERVLNSKHPIFIKRDDAIPFGFGGNKVRKLEVVMAEALAAGATTVLTCGGVQSNHCRATAAAATLRKAEVWDRFASEGYGQPTEASREALGLLARSEGLLVDHTYGAKALAGLIDLVRGGTLPSNLSLLFWHTGGQVGVLA